MTAVQEIINTIEGIKKNESLLSKNDLLTILKATKKISKHKQIMKSLISFFIILEENSNSNEKALTNRELEILNLIGNGNQSKTIAYQLGLSLSTIETHRKNIKRKLNLKGKNKLLEYAIINNLKQR